jgi:hypothetical protein
MTAVVAVQAQIPSTFRNLQVLPKDIPSQELLQRMREFSFALDVRCQYCHAGGDGVSFEGVDFASDAKPPKRIARDMLRLVRQLNTRDLPATARRSDPPVQVDCVTCHRGLPIPRTIETELLAVIRESGIEAAVRRYRDLRANAQHMGLFRFTEWPVTELARSLAESGDVASAIRILELNREYYPESSAIVTRLVDAYLKVDRRSDAITLLEQFLEAHPDQAALAQRLREIRGG